MMFNKFSKKLMKDQSGQGATEYILLLVVVVVLATMFREPIKKALGDKVEQVTGKIQGFGVD